MAKNPRNNSKPLPGINGHWAPRKDTLKSPGTVGNYRRVLVSDAHWTLTPITELALEFLLSASLNDCDVRVRWFLPQKTNRSKSPRSGSQSRYASGQRNDNLGPWLVLFYVLNLRAARGLSTGLVTNRFVDPWFEVLFEGQNCRFKWGSMVSRAHSWWLYDWNLIGGMSLFISTLPDYNQLIKIALWLPVKYLQYISA